MDTFSLQTKPVTLLSYAIKALTVAALAAASANTSATPGETLEETLRRAVPVPAQERSIGRGINDLIEERGKPTKIVEGVGGHRILEYDDLPGCKQTFIAWRELVVSGTGSGSKCPQPFPTYESLEIANIPGEVRYDGPAGLEIVGIRAATRLATDDYAGLDRLFDEMKNPQMRLNDGRWMAMGLEALAYQYGRYMTRETAYQKIQAWKKHNPQSAGAAIFESMYWQAAAWQARGEGPASSVSEEGWQLFRERMTKAEDALRAAESFGPEHPTWYSEYLYILHATGRPKKELLALFEEAKMRYPQYLQFYFTMINDMQPRWGGSYRLIEWFIREQQRGLQPKEAAMLYTRLYWALQSYEGSNFDLFRDSMANWKEMREGFVLLTKENPLSLWHANNFAVFACRARDRKTYLEVRPTFGAQIRGGAWPSNLSLEICDRRFTHQS